MAEPAVRGECLCGRVKFSLSAPALLTVACHCRGCQRLTGGPYSLGIAYPKSAFAHDAGDVEVGGLHGASRYMMCAYCKSWLWTEPEGMDIINVRTPMLAAPPNEPPIVEIATDEGFGWARIGARFSFSGFPDVTEFGPVLAAYSRAEAN